MVLEMKTTVLRIGNRNNICMAIAFSFWGLKLIHLNLIRLNWSEMPLKPCLKYTPPESTNQKLDANEMRLEFVVAFNDSDSTAGWFQFFLGTTLYLSSQGCMDYHSGPNYQPLTINGLSIWHHHAPLSKHSWTDTRSNVFSQFKPYENSFYWLSSRKWAYFET